MNSPSPSTEFNYVRGFTLMAVSILLLIFVTGARLITDSARQNALIKKEKQKLDIRQGKKLFYGKYKAGALYVSCAGCHRLSYVDSLDWQPSAFDISSLYYDKDTQALIQVLRNPQGKMLRKVHVNIDLTNAQISQLKVFMNNYQSMGTPVRKRFSMSFLLIIFITLLVGLLLLDIFIYHRLRPRWISLLLLLIAAGFQTGYLFHHIQLFVPYAPLQPVKFSHMIHVKEYHMDCRYCHSYVTQGKDAGIPAVNICMQCHNQIREGARSGQFEINKLQYAMEHSAPVAWIRVYTLPDHVFFSHEQHVAAGKMNCTECHGPVEQMNVTRKEQELTMEWCINCHITRKVQAGGMKLPNGSGRYESQKPIDNDCISCHY